MENTPLLSAFAEPIIIEPLKSFTVLPASAVPVINGVLSFVIEDDVLITGAFGAFVSIVRGIEEEGSDMFPAASVELAVKE